VAGEAGGGFGATSHLELLQNARAGLRLRLGGVPFGEVGGHVSDANQPLECVGLTPVRGSTRNSRRATPSRSPICENVPELDCDATMPDPATLIGSLGDASQRFQGRRDPPFAGLRPPGAFDAANVLALVGVGEAVVGGTGSRVRVERAGKILGL
jgi:hypothetical protein